MNGHWLPKFVLLMLANGAAADTADNNSAAADPTEREISKHTQDIQPDKALLLFLAEWDETQDGQWLEPTDFAADSAFTEQLESPNSSDHTKNTHENNPDHH